MLRTTGIHHITAYARDVQENVDFYAGFLGLRLVKQTVHFDAPQVYHLYYGSASGNPGTIVSFLIKENMRTGRLGGGQVGVTVFAVPVGGLFFWRSRLKRFGIDSMEIRRFGEDYVRFTDNSGLLIDLVERGEGSASGWAIHGIPGQYAVKALDGALLFSKHPEETAAVLEHSLGLRRADFDEGLLRFEAAGEHGRRVDLSLNQVHSGSMGAGVIDHLAWRTKDAAEQILWQDQLSEQGLEPSPAVNMEYYKSVYFQEPGGINFHISTDKPGFETDETLGELGGELMLPDALEMSRDAVVKRLKPFRVRELG